MKITWILALYVAFTVCVQVLLVQRLVKAFATCL